MHEEMRAKDEGAQNSRSKPRSHPHDSTVVIDPQREIEVDLNRAVIPRKTNKPAVSVDVVLQETVKGLWDKVHQFVHNGYHEPDQTGFGAATREELSVKGLTKTCHDVCANLKKIYDLSSTHQNPESITTGGFANQALAQTELYLEMLYSLSQDGAVAESHRAELRRGTIAFKAEIGGLIQEMKGAKFMIEHGGEGQE